MTVDTFLFNAGWLFFAAWIAVIVGVTVAAFGRELLPWDADADPTRNSYTESVRPIRPSAH